MGQVVIELIQFLRDYFGSQWPGRTSSPLQQGTTLLLLTAPTKVTGVEGYEKWAASQGKKM